MERFERSGTVVDPRQSLAMWLRAGRAQRKLSLEDVARITKIQRRILEKLEAGQLDGLPAEVFVRGFVRSFARCVGLDEGEALDRYGACHGGIAIARALIDTMAIPRKIEIVDVAPLIPEVVAAAVEVAPAIEVVAAPAVEVAEVIEAKKK